MESFQLNFYHLWMIIIFIAGYFFVTVEHSTKVNKTGITLLMAVLMWVILFWGSGVTHTENLDLFYGQLSNVSQVILFILGALAIVETISSHKGFNIISKYIPLGSKKKVLWVIAILTFFLSALLDNLTTTIIMITLMQKLIDERQDRLVIGGAIVIAANAGGVWTPIGDVTTTMLWIGGQISTFEIIKQMLIPSLICMTVSISCLSFFLKGNFQATGALEIDQELEPEGNFIFWLGIALLVFVPIFKIITGLPPFMGIIFGVGVLWLVTDFIHTHEDRDHLKLPQIFSKIDISGVLFFLGILLSIAALEVSGLLDALAHQLNHFITNPHYVAIALGLLSAIIDNIPLVAASMGMYSLEQFPMDSSFWQSIAFCAGTGGSILIIGSAAGIAFLNIEKVSFFWYARRIGLSALIGYLAGIGYYLMIV